METNRCCYLQDGSCRLNQPQLHPTYRHYSPLSCSQGKPLIVTCQIDDVQAYNLEDALRDLSCPTSREAILELEKYLLNALNWKVNLPTISDMTMLFL